MTIENIINMIETPALKELVMAIIAILPKYWFEIPASTSGKYHPTFSLENGGLVRHSIVVAYLARRIALAQGMSIYEQDILTVSGLIHDGLKCGYNEENLPIEMLHTVHEHPILMAGFLYAKFEGNKDAELIAHIVKSHMGKWNTSKYSDVVLPVPEDKLQCVLSAADMSAATKELGFNFDK